MIAKRAIKEPPPLLHHQTRQGHRLQKHRPPLPRRRRRRQEFHRRLLQPIQHWYALHRRLLIHTSTHCYQDFLGCQVFHRRHH